MNVCWLTTSPAPYTISLFIEIGKKINLSVVLNDELEANRNSEWNVKDNNSFKLFKIDKNYNDLIKKLANENDILIDGFYLSKYGYKAVSEFKKCNKKVILAADGGIARNRGFLINSVMSYLMNRHDYFLSSSIITDKYFKYYKVNEDKIYHYKFTSLTKEDIKHNKVFIKNRESLRQKLCFDKFVLLSVGRPIKVKGFDTLLKAYKKTGLTNLIDLYIVGGKPQKDIARIVEDNNLDNVHFIDVISSEELKEYYAASDASIICSRGDVWGLVINEALSFGLPTISSNMCVAGLHFSLLGNNPMICKVDDIDDFSNAIKKLYENIKLRCEMSKQAFEEIKEYSIENSCEDIINILSLL